MPKKFTQTDKFLCKEFFSGKSVSVIARDLSIATGVSRGEAQEKVYEALKNFAYDYSIDFS